MEPIFDINEYSSMEDVMVCETKDEARLFAEYLDSIGRTWSDGDSYIHFRPYDSDVYYNREKKGFVFYFNEDEYGSYEFWSSECFGEELHFAECFVENSTILLEEPNLSAYFEQL